MADETRSPLEIGRYIILGEDHRQVIVKPLTNNVALAAAQFDRGIPENIVKRGLMNLLSPNEKVTEFLSNFDKHLIRLVLVSLPDYHSNPNDVKNLNHWRLQRFLKESGYSVEVSEDNKGYQVDNVYQCSVPMQPIRGSRLIDHKIVELGHREILSRWYNNSGEQLFEREISFI